MKQTILAVLVLGVAALVNAQATAKREVLASQGGTNRNETVQLEWTLGEAATSANYYGAAMLTEGFHQPDFQITIVAQTNPGPTRATRVFPNPTTGVLRVIIGETDNPVTRITLLNNIGCLLTEQRMQSPSIQEMDLTPYPAGVYLLRIRSADGLHNEVFQVIKQH